MFVTLTQFRLKEAISLEGAREIFRSTAPKYRNVPGLLRKHYVCSEDGLTVGGFYLWRSRADAEALFTPAWHDFVREKYGTEPQLSYFANPLWVDNQVGEIGEADLSQD